MSAVWAAFVVTNVFVLFHLHRGDWIGDESLWALLSLLNRSYLPYLGAIIGFYSSLRMLKPADTVPLAAVITALLSAAAWNGGVTYFVFQLLWPNGDLPLVTAVQQNIDKYVSIAGWIVAPSMGFFFGSHFRAPTSKRTKATQAGGM
jgi:hypothetical protein